MAAPAVAVERVSKAFGPTKVIDGLDLSITTGEVVALLGPSGCGKSTLLRLISGLERVDRGSVAIGDRVVSGDGTHVPPEERQVGLVFQNGALFPHLDVTRNVGYGLPKAQRRGGPRVTEVLELVGLSRFGDRMPDSLSGGQQQRVALARALAPSPSVLLMDEPFSNLDAILRRRLRREVGDVIRAAGVTTLFVTHDRDEAFAIADRVAVMFDGRISQVGVPHEVYREPVDDRVAAFVGDVTEWRGARNGNGVVRPEDLELTGPDHPEAEVGIVESVEYHGATVLTEVRTRSGTVVAVRSLTGADGPLRHRGDAVGVRPRPSAT